VVLEFHPLLNSETKNATSRTGGILVCRGRNKTAGEYLGPAIIAGLYFVLGLCLITIVRVLKRFAAFPETPSIHGSTTGGCV
jgi:hypothetical protein